MTVLAIIMMLVGAFFLIVSCVGIIRLPDFYSRIHAVGKSETLGAILVLGGLALYNGLEIGSLKLLLILIFVLIANPTAAHLLGRSALRSRLEIWTNRDGSVLNKNHSVETIKQRASRQAGKKGTSGDKKDDMAT